MVQKENFYLLGICVGMQVLFKKSEEGNLDGLGLLDGEVIKFNNSNNFNLKIPHMGWNNLKFKSEKNIFFSGKKRFYFAHSFYASCCDDLIISKTNHIINFPSIVSNKKNIIGFQFHPEKSYENGLNLINEFIKIDA